jgi:hypothetical protein
MTDGIELPSLTLTPALAFGRPALGRPAVGKRARERAREGTT